MISISNQYCIQKVVSVCAFVILAFICQQGQAQKTLTGEAQINIWLKQMTLDEKVAMCHAQSKFTSKGVPRLGIPEVTMSDGPHGVRAEVNWDNWSAAGWTNDSCTAFPALTCLAATFNPQMSLLYGQAIGEEARYRNKDVLLGPGVNIYRTPLNGRNFEYMGEDPYLSSIMVVPYIKGVQQNAVAACVKHYAFNNQELWRSSVDVSASDRAMFEIYLPAFKAAVMEGKAWSIMGSYNKFRGEHCCHNDLLLNKILKDEWKFDGVVISDWGGVHNTTQAINNGLDIEMGTGTDGFSKGAKNAYDFYYLANAYKTALRNGEASMTVLNDKVSRILRMILRTSMSKNRPFGSLVSEAHSTAARKVAEEGIVLLKNQDNFLPLNLKEVKTIAVIGENATRSLTIGGGSSGLKVKYEVSPLQGLLDKVGNSVNINYQMGYASGASDYNKEEASSYDADSLMREAVTIASKADVVIYVGGLNKNHLQDSEDGDRAGLNLPFGQDKLLTEILKVNKKVAIVLISGNAVAMPWVNDVPAILQSWYLGSEAGNAIASVLLGEVNPSGKLPFTFPVQLSDNGAHSFGAISYPGIDKKQEYKEDILVGYRWHDTKKIEPLFAFGHGLSYTNFLYKNLQLSRVVNGVVTATFTITNTGKVYGGEVAQLYVHKKNSSIIRAEKELKGFQKVFLNPGESKSVSIQLKNNAFQYYDETKKDWATEKGEYEIQVGGSSRTIRLNEKVIL